MAENAAVISIQGQVIHSRALSKKLVFYDLKRNCKDGEEGSLPTHMELVVKLDVYGDVAAVQRVRDTVHLGDIISASGHIDEAGSLRVTSLTTLTPWSQLNASSPDKPGGKQFAPDEESVAWWAEQFSRRSKTHASSHTGQGQAPSELLGTHTGRTPASQHAAHVAREQGVAAAVAAAVSYSATRVKPGHAAARTGLADPESLPDQGDGAEAVEARVCKFWLNTGRCARGALCSFLHVDGVGARKAAKKAYLVARKEQKAAGAAAEGFAVHAAGGAAAKRRRATLLAQWLVDEFGAEALNQGTGVLDVAGGRGALTFQLQVMHGVKVTLVEPRPFKLSRFQHQTLDRLAEGGGTKGARAGACSEVGDDEDGEGEQGDEDAPMVDTPSQNLIPTNQDLDLNQGEDQHQGLATSSGRVGKAPKLPHTPAAGGPTPPPPPADTQASPPRTGPQSQPPPSVLPARMDSVTLPAALTPIHAAGGVQFNQIRAWFTTELWQRAVQVYVGHKQPGQPGPSSGGEGTRGQGCSGSGGNVCGTSSVADGSCGSSGSSGITGRVGGNEVGPPVTWPGGSLGGEELADALYTIAHCSLVVGLHPDQATEEIIGFANSPLPGGAAPQSSPTPTQQGTNGSLASEDLANRTPGDPAPRRPFVIVPCCVFGRLFPNRRLRTRVPVPVPAPPAGCGGDGSGSLPLVGEGTGRQVSSKAEVAATPSTPAAGDAGHAPQSPPAGDAPQPCGQAAVSDGGKDTAGVTSSAVGAGGSMWDEPEELMSHARRAAQAQSSPVPGVSAQGASGAASVVMEDAGQGGTGWAEEAVVSYPQLVRYLVQEGGEGTAVKVMPFEGANKVVYRKG